VRWIGVTIIAAIMCLTPGAWGEVLQFQPTPTNTLREFIYTGGSSGQLQAGPGSFGQGDVGVVNVTNPTLQDITPGGLSLNVPFVITTNAIWGKQVNVPGNNTTFFDVTLKLTGFTASDPATFTFIPMPFPLPAIQFYIQPLGAGTIELWSTNNVLLLRGTTNSAYITGFNQSASALTAKTLFFTGGYLMNFIDGSQPGDFSFSLLDVTPPIGYGPYPPPNGPYYLNAFVADATGNINVVAVPTPGAAAAGLVLLAGLVAWRRWR
jgi:hypothetical protein